MCVILTLFYMCALLCAYSVQFISVAQSCWLCNPLDCSMPGLPVHHQLPEFIQTHVHWVGDVIPPSHPLSFPFPPVFNLSQHQGFFPVSWLFASGGQSYGAWASASFFPLNVQVWFPLGLTGLISLQSKGLSTWTNPVHLMSLVLLLGFLLQRWVVEGMLWILFFPRCLQWVCKAEVKRSQLWLI